jgi:sugar phosphate isomerase/epimerase
MTPRQLRQFMLVILAALLGIGIIAVYSTSALASDATYGSSLRVLTTHLLAIVCGVSLGVCCLMIPYPVLRRSARWLLLASLVLLGLVLLFGQEVGGARRWFHFGRWSLQPSEFAQLALVLYLSDVLARNADHLQDFWRGLLPPLAATGLVAGMVRLEPDLGTALAMGTGAGWVVQRLRLTDHDLAVRQQARDFIREVIDVAGAFGAPAIIGSMQGRTDVGISHEQHLVWLAEALDELAPRAADHGTTLLIEPLNRYETNLINSVADGVKLIGSLKAKNVRLLCDLFHMNIEEPDIAIALSEAGSQVGHVHFADSNRRAVGFGHTPMPPIIGALRRIGYDGYLSAEVLPLPDSHEAARQTIKSFQQFVVKPRLL